MAITFELKQIDIIDGAVDKVKMNALDDSDDSTTTITYQYVSGSRSSLITDSFVISSISGVESAIDALGNLITMDKSARQTFISREVGGVTVEKYHF